MVEVAAVAVLAAVVDVVAKTVCCWLWRLRWRRWLFLRLWWSGWRSAAVVLCLLWLWRTAPVVVVLGVLVVEVVAAAAVAVVIVVVVVISWLRWRRWLCW